MTKIGLVGGTKIYHGMSFAEMFNGYNKELSIEKGWGPQYAERVGGDVRITHVWDEKEEDAKESAEICGIENVVSKKEDMIGKVDGVLIADDCTMKHQKRARPFLEAGIPAFVDKPLSPDIKEAEEIVEFAKKCNAPIMSCSGLRYAKETEPFRKGEDSIGDILTGFAVGREGHGDLIFYGIHALEFLYSIIGGGIESVRNMGKKSEDILFLKYKDGRSFVVTAYENIKVNFQVNLYGTEGFRLFAGDNAGYYYSEMMRNFVNMVQTKKEPFPPEETLEIIKILVLGKKSGESGAEIKL